MKDSKSGTESGIESSNSSTLSTTSSSSSELLSSTSSTSSRSSSSLGSKKTKRSMGTVRIADFAGLTDQLAAFGGPPIFLFALERDMLEELKEATQGRLTGRKKKPTSATLQEMLAAIGIDPKEEGILASHPIQIVHELTHSSKPADEREMLFKIAAIGLTKPLEELNEALKKLAARSLREKLSMTGIFGSSITAELKKKIRNFNLLMETLERVKNNPERYMDTFLQALVLVETMSEFIKDSSTHELEASVHGHVKTFENSCFNVINTLGSIAKHYEAQKKIVDLGTGLHQITEAEQAKRKEQQLHIKAALEGGNAIPHESSKADAVSPPSSPRATFTFEPLPPSGGSSGSLKIKKQEDHSKTHPHHPGKNSTSD